MDVNLVKRTAEWQDIGGLNALSFEGCHAFLFLQVYIVATRRLAAFEKGFRRGGDANG